MGAKKLVVEEIAVADSVFPSLERQPAMTEAGHRAIVEAGVARALAIPDAEVRRSDVPVNTMLDEGFAFVRAAREVKAELLAVGLRPTAIDEYEQELMCTLSAQVLGAGTRPRRRSEAARLVLERSHALLAESGACAKLALRGLTEASRAAELAATSAEADLGPAMAELATIVTASPEAFAAKRIDAEKLASSLAALAEQTRVVLAEEETARRLNYGADLRDRFQTLANRLLEEIRAHAEFAFRHDSARKRALFTSDYVRARNRRYANKKKIKDALRAVEGGEAESANDDEPGSSDG